MVKLRELFDMCLNAKYQTIEGTDADFCIKRSGTKLFLLLECSNQKKDWIHNFDFAGKPYHDMPKKWKAHRGFVKVWKSIIPFIEDQINDPTVTQIVTVGYSHGAALTCLAQEYIWFNRPDIRDNCFAFAFESPRVFCGWRRPAYLRERWSNLFVFRNGKDLVTHVPPRLFGFKHVGNFIRIGQSRKNVIRSEYLNKWYIPKSILEHDWINVQNSLDEYENSSEIDENLAKILKNIKKR